MSEKPAPLHILISGGEGDLARALQAEFLRDGDQVQAPGRKTMTSPVTNGSLPDWQTCTPSPPVINTNSRNSWS